MRPILVAHNAVADADDPSTRDVLAQVGFVTAALDVLDLLREALGGETVASFMTQSPVTVSSDLSLQHLVDDFVYRYHHKLFPVVDNGQLSGCITTQQVKEISGK